jgi:hypothetical protein
MRWLFVTGISLDISGAILVLGAILFAQTRDVAQEAVTYPGYNDAVLVARVRERRFAYGGATLLVLGLLLQLGGYAWMFSSWWLLVYALAVVIAPMVLAVQGMKRLPWKFHERADELMRKAVEH